MLAVDRRVARSRSRNARHDTGGCAGAGERRAGRTAEAIAAHRGTSVRTAQRKVQSLMAVAHVRTRMRLAWEAAKQGWM